MTTHEQRKRRARKGTGVMEYRDHIVLNEQHGVRVLTDDSIEPILDHLREQGTAEVTYSVAIVVEAEDTWDLRDRLDELETYLASEGINWTADKAKVREVVR